VEAVYFVLQAFAQKGREKLPYQWLYGVNYILAYKPFVYMLSSKIIIGLTKVMKQLLSLLEPPQWIVV
jgi:hypothetical protein